MSWCRTKLAVLLALSLVSCDYIAYPISQVSYEIGSLRHYAISGNVLDDAGLLSTATLAVDNAPPKPLRYAHFNVQKTAARVTYAFAAPGYYPRTFEFNHDGFFEVMPDSPSYPVNLLTPAHENPRDLRIVLDNVEKPAHLLHFAVSFSNSVTHRSTTLFDFDYPDLRGSTILTETPNSNPLPPLPANGLFLRATQEPDDPHVIAGTPPSGRDYRAYPQHIELVSTSSIGGLQWIPFEDGRFVNGRPRLAPESGYEKQLVLDEPALHTLTKTHYMPFYFQAGKLFGRGVITDFSSEASSPHAHILFVNLQVTFHIQPDGSRNVE